MPRLDFRDKFSVGLSFVKASMTGQLEDEPHKDVSCAWASPDLGEIVVTYKPNRDNQGFSELKIWCHNPLRRCPSLSVARDSRRDCPIRRMQVPRPGDGQARLLPGLTLQHLRLVQRQ